MEKRNLVIEHRIMKIKQKADTRFIMFMKKQAHPNSYGLKA